MDKPPVIKKDRCGGKQKGLISLVIIIILNAVAYQWVILKDVVKDEERAWNREGSFYKDLRDKGLSRLSALSHKFDNLNKEKIEIEKRLDTLLTEKDALQKEKKELQDSLQDVKLKAQEDVKNKEDEFRTSLSMEYEKETEALKEKAAEAEKLREELVSQKDNFQKIEQDLKVKNEEIKKLTKKNKDFLNSLTKANQSNEQFMKRIEDLRKIRDELEGELRRKNE